METWQVNALSSRALSSTCLEGFGRHGVVVCIAGDLRDTKKMRLEASKYSFSLREYVKMEWNTGHGGPYLILNTMGALRLSVEHACKGKQNET